MPKTWFTSDLHLGHNNILKHQPNRPWETVRQMDDALISNVNALVSPADELYILGDFTMGGSYETVRAYRERIRCRHVYLVYGNHDKRFGESGAASPWSWERDYYELKCLDRYWELFHYPIQAPSWKRSHHGSIHPHGHIHTQGSSYNEAQLEQGFLRYDVGVDANNFLPVSAEQILAFLCENAS